MISSGGVSRVHDSGIKPWAATVKTCRKSRYNVQVSPSLCIGFTGERRVCSGWPCLST